MKLVKKLQEITHLKLDYNPKHLIMEALGIKLDQLYSLLQVELSNKQIEIIDKCVEAAQNRIPISRITGQRFFWKNLFHVSEYTLDPRPETECLIQYVLDEYPNQKPVSILDLGTGTGCILLSLLDEFPEAKGTAVDLSEKALETAKLNSYHLGITSERVEFLQSNWYEKINTKFDLIVSNPPYIKTYCDYEAMFDPPISLFDSNTYEQIITSKHITDYGKMFLETPDYCLDTIKELAVKHDLRMAPFDAGVGISICRLSKS